MTEVSPSAIFLALLILQTKHFIFDYVLQTPFQYSNKGRYGHPGGLLHAGLHAAGTPLAFLAIKPTLLGGVLILVGEFVLHYHIDWTKERIVRLSQLTPDKAAYWQTHGADQFCHQLTYTGIAAILTALAG